MNVTFEKIGNTKTLSQQVYSHIENAIRDKKLQVGEKLPTEKELCDMFGVSRTALREALQMLSARGLISIRKGSGIFVNNFSSKDVSKSFSLYLELNFDKNTIQQVVQARQIIEPPIARLAALNRTEEDLRKIELNMMQLLECQTSDTELEGKIDRDFHMLISKASHNSVLAIMLDPLFRLMPKIKEMVYEKIEDAKGSAVEYHKHIYSKIKEQDGEGAFLAMQKHLAIAEEHSQRLIKAQLL